MMNHDSIPFATTHAFSSFFLDYMDESPALKSFYHRFPKIQSFEEQIREKEVTFPAEARKTLVSVLTAQYNGYEINPKLDEHLKSLGNPTAFTVTTGHQLNIFTGPLYFIYKIVTVINACKRLRQEFPHYTFVPVYWMASEDHDFEEISYFKLEGRKFVWSTDQQGAVGRFDPTSIESLLSQIPGDTKLFREAYLKHDTLSKAVRYYVNALFGHEGLVVVDADDHRLKSSFKSVMKTDLFEGIPKREVDATNAKLKTLGYEAQVHARDINFFYLDKGLRSRIESRDGKYIVLDTSLSFDRQQMEALIDKEPEKLSPNVILRPLYQEMILPNLAYVGGPAEVVYWLQLKSTFAHFGTPFPMLMPRNFALVMNGPVARKFDKTGLSLEELFEEKHFLFNHWVVKHTTHDLSLGASLSAIHEIYEAIRHRAAAIDGTLDAFVGAEGKRAQNGLAKIEVKMKRAEKRYHTDKLRQIEEVKDTLFPNNSPQERSENFLSFYRGDPQFIAKLIQQFDPFDFRFNIFRYPFS